MPPESSGFAPDAEMPRVSITKALRARVIELERAITEHQKTVVNAGTVRVHRSDIPAAKAKQRADGRLWAVLAIGEERVVSRCLNPAA